MGWLILLPETDRFWYTISGWTIKWTTTKRVSRRHILHSSLEDRSRTSSATTLHTDGSNKFDPTSVETTSQATLCQEEPKQCVMSANGLKLTWSALPRCSRSVIEICNLLWNRYRPQHRLVEKNRTRTITKRARRCIPQWSFEDRSPSSTTNTLGTNGFTHGASNDRRDFFKRPQITMSPISE